MNIVLLSQRFLYPLDTGGKIRTANILRHLGKEHQVTVVGNIESAKEGAHRHHVEKLCHRYVGVEWIEPTRGSPAFYRRLLRHLISAYPVTVLNDYSRELEQVLLQTVHQGDFDLAICDFVQSALLFRNIHGVPRILFQHNVEAQILARHAGEAANGLTRAFWHVQHRRMSRFESRAVRTFDAVIAVSADDAEVFMSDYGAPQVHQIPTGVDLDFYQPQPMNAPAGLELVFCGSMDWLPNEDAMRFFIHDVLPLLDGLIDGWRFTVVGRNPSAWLRRVAARSGGRIRVTGWVDDVRPYLARAAVSVVPLRIGGGTRLKIYEAMAMARPIVSTRIGAEGLDIDNGTTIRLADDAGAFAQAVAGLLRDPGGRVRMGAAARALVEKRFGWERVAERFSDICLEVVEAWRASGASA